MSNKKNAQLPPVSMEVYRQLVFDCGAMLMSEDCDKEDVINRLISLADRPITEASDSEQQLKNAEQRCENCRSFVQMNLRQVVCEHGKDDPAICGRFSSRYMTFPMTIESISIRRAASSKDMKPAELVKVRLAGEEPSKTHLGFLLNDVGTDFSMSYNRETKTLRAFVYNNPPIFVPALGRVVFGYESWWSRIESESDLSDITDEDIENTWYVKAWKSLANPEG